MKISFLKNPPQMILLPPNKVMSGIPKYSAANPFNHCQYRYGGLKYIEIFQN